jgi:16S rRNA U516 pseudouridylate synthase RsuA-like enzyme
MKADAFIAQFGIFSREGRIQPASRSEVRRWIEAGAVQINGERLRIADLIDFPVFSLVLFPGGKRVSLA